MTIKTLLILLFIAFLPGLPGVTGGNAEETPVPPAAPAAAATETPVPSSPEFLNLPDVAAKGLAVTVEVNSRNLNQEEAQKEGKKTAILVGLRSLIQYVLRSSEWMQRQEEFDRDFIAHAEDFIPETVIRSENRTWQNTKFEILLKPKLGDLIRSLYGKGYTFDPSFLPRTVLVIPYRQEGGTFPAELPVGDNTAEKLLGQFLREKGFPVIPREELLREVPKEQQPDLMFKPDPEAGAAAVLAHADVLVRGSVEVKPAGEATLLTKAGMMVLQATAFFHAVRCTDGTVLFSDRVVGEVVHLSEATGAPRAMEEAVGKIREQLAAEVLTEWMLSSTSISRVVIRLKDLPNRLALHGFLRHLKAGFPMVRRAEQAEFKEGEARIDVDVVGNPDAFLDLLEQQKLVIIRSQDGYKVEAKLVDGS